LEEKIMKRWRPIFLSLLVALALVLAACGGDETPEATEEAVPEATEAAPAATEAPEPTEPAPSEPIRIGMLTDLTSNFAPWGVQVRDGMLMAAEEINAAGGVNGRMIEIVEADSQNNADASTEAVERLVEDGVVAIGGIISSGVGVPAAALAEELQVPLFLVKSGTDVALTQDSRFTFRTCLPAAPMDAVPVLQYAEEQGLTKVGAIIADYAWGQAMKSALETTFAGSDVAIQIEVAPVPPDTDFTTYLRALTDFGAEMIVATGHPPGSGPITVLSQDYLNVPVTGSWTPFSLVVGNLAEAAIGRYADFACADYLSDEYEGLARRYLAFSDNSFMSDDAVAAHGIVTMVADAVAAVGDDPVAIAEYLHGQTYDLEGYAHEMSWTEWGELAASQPMLFLVNGGPPPEGVSEAGDWWLDLLVHSEPLEPYVPGS
jgi:branched-chain amino acid transport system substrate-binding protein